MFSYMKVRCPICCKELDGMRGRGRDNINCCGKECYQEWEWRKTLAIMGEEYRESREVKHD